MAIRLGPEEKTQHAFMQYLRYAHPKIRDLVVKIDNEGKRSQVAGYVSKILGLHPGASDIFIPKAHGGKHGLWIEVKRDGWKYTSNQRDHYNRQMVFIEKMRDEGYGAKMCVGTTECIETLERYLD